MEGKQVGLGKKETDREREREERWEGKEGETAGEKRAPPA